jgi:hypothetical protein
MSVMNRDTEKAKSLLTENQYTCVLCLDGREYHSTERGVRPLLDFLDLGESFCGFSAADKTVGAGAAHLYVLLGVKSLFASIISKEGKRILEENGIDVFYDTEVSFIINRAQTGMCPIESAVFGVNDSKKALEIIRKTLKELAEKA